ncbi:MAG: hypothetical protein R3F39_25130 [Myxococcota bacterium]
MRQYASSYHPAPEPAGRLVDIVADEADLNLERQRLFPLSAPNEVAENTHQHPGRRHPGGRPDPRRVPIYGAFQTALAQTRDRTAQGIDAVTTDSAETQVAAQAHLKAREDWDRPPPRQALRDITASFLHGLRLDRHAPSSAFARRGGKRHRPSHGLEAPAERHPAPHPTAEAAPPRF